MLSTVGMAQEPEQVSPEPAAPSQTTTLPEIVVETTEQEQAAPKKKSTASSSQASPQPAAVPPVAEKQTQTSFTSPPDSFVATRSAAGTKTDTPILETPQSISVITSDQMQTRGVRTVNEALQYTPGVYTQIGGFDPRYDSFKIRGFNSQGFGTFRDGLKELGSADYFGHFRNEIYGMERIDVIRGPSSVLYGQTAPGGLINIVTKRPTEETLREFVGTIGTDERFQGAFDMSGAVDEDGKLLFRLVGVARDSDAQVAHFSDFVEDDRLFLAPSFTFRPDDDTTLTVLTDFQHDETGNAFSAARFYPNFPPSAAYATPTTLFTGDPNYDQFEQDQFRIGYLFEHRFDDTFTVRQNLRYGELDLDYRYLLGGIVADTASEFRSPRAVKEDTRTFAIDNQLQAKFATGAMKHTVVTGLDHQHFWLDNVFYYDTSAYFLDVANPVYGLDIPYPTLVQASNKQETTQTGVYAQDQTKIDNWVLTFGGRYDWARVETLDRLSTDPAEVQNDEAFSGRAGLTYVFDFGLAPYVSYSESFLPTAGFGYDRNADAQYAFEPTTGQQYEAGIKYEFGSELTATIAVFDITQQNVLTPDEDNSGPGSPCGNSCQRQTGEVRSRGFEAEVVATLAQGLKLTAAYTALDVEVTKTEKDEELGKVPILTPEEMASFYADYTFQSGPLAGFGFGFGARYIGKSYQDAINNYTNPAYTVFDGGVHYDFDEGTRLQVSAQNIFGKNEAICSNTGGCQWISPRIVNAELRYRW